MDEKLGLVAYEDERRTFLPGTDMDFRAHRYSEQTSREIDCAVHAVLTRAFDQATRLLTAARKVLEHGARQLLEKETLGESELAELRQTLELAVSAPRVAGLPAQTTGAA